MVNGVLLINTAANLLPKEHPSPATACNKVTANQLHSTLRLPSTTPPAPHARLMPALALTLPLVTVLRHLLLTLVHLNSLYRVWFLVSL